MLNAWRSVRPLSVMLLASSMLFAAPASAATSADLQVTITDSRDPIRAPTDQVTYTVTVINNGPSAAAATTLTLTLTDDVRIVSWDADVPTECQVPSPPTWTCQNLTSSPGLCTGLGTPHPPPCSAGETPPSGDLDVGGRFKYFLTVQPKAAGTITLRAQVSSSTADPTPANNSAAESTQVTGAAMTTQASTTGWSWRRR